MRTQRTMNVLGALCAALLATSVARADAATAEALFREGHALLEKGDLEQACPKLAESYAQEASSGTLLNLALCHEKQGRIATAWAEYASASSLARSQSRPDRAQSADQKMTELEPRLPHLTLRVASPTPGLRVARDGAALGEGVFGVASPVDPGAHQLSASAAGYKSWSATVELREGEARTVDVPALEAEASASPTASAPSVPPPMTVVPPSPAAPGPPPDSGSSGSTVGWLVAGTGLVALGVGAGFGIASLNSYSTADTACKSHTDCSDDALSARDRADTQAWISNIGIGVGVIGLGLGAYLLLGHSGDGQRTTALRATPTRGGAWLGLDARF